MPISLSGSLIITGSLTTTGEIIMSGSIASASYATNAANSTLFNNTASSVFATTGSNTFTGTQYISNTNNATGFSSTTSSIYTDGGLQVTKDAYYSSSLFIKGNLTVFGTQSVSFITSSQLNISTNLITVNTDTPSIRFGGLAVYDSGSTGLTGSILWDSQNNHWIYTNPSGSSYSGGMLISGPRASSLGEEQGTTLNAIMKGMGGDHITSSAMFESGSNVGIGTSSPAYTLDVNGTGRFSGDLRITNNNWLVYTDSTATARNILTLASNDNLYLQYKAGSNFYLRNTDGDLRLTISSTGAATFSSSVTAGGLVSSFTSNANSNNGLNIVNSGTVGYGGAVTFNIGSGGINYNSARIYSENEGTGGTFRIQTANTSQVLSDRLTISNTGAATFSSSVTVGGNAIVQNGNTLSVYRTDNTRALQLYTTINECVIDSWEASSEPLHIRSNGSGGRIQFFTNATERMRITSAGNIGIGISTPAGAHMLQINNPTQNYVRMNMTNTSTGTSNSDGLIFQQEIGNSIIKNQENGYFAFGVNGSETNLVIAQGGNISINSTVANYKFQVNSGINTSTATVMTLQQATNGAVKDAAGFGLAINNGGESTNAADLIISTASGGSLGEKMRITSAGVTAIAASSNTSDLGSTGLVIGGSSTLTSGNVLMLNFIPIGHTSNRARAGIGCLVGTDWGKGNLTFYTQDASSGAAMTTANERMRITSDGNLLFNTAGSSAAYIQVNQATSQDGGILWYRNNVIKWQNAITNPGDNMNWYSYTIGNQAFALNTNGSATLYGALTQNASDRRLKNNIVNIPNALDKIKTLNGVTFNWENDIFKTERTNDIGVIAQEVKEILPEAVTIAPFDNDGEGNSKSGENYLTVYYEKLIPLLIEGVKELKAQNDTLITRIEQLENK